MKKVKFDVNGMTCSSCSSHVEKAVSKVKGVEKVAVNLLSNNMIVEYDEHISSNNDIINAVVDAGYGASVAENKEDRKEIKDYEKKAKFCNSDRQVSNVGGMKKRLIISFIFLIPLMYIAMHNMLSSHFGLGVPNWIANLFDGSKNVFNFAFTQFLLLIPIVYVNRSYFSNGIKRLLKRTPTMDSLIAIGSGASIIYGIYSLYNIGMALGRQDLIEAQTFAENLYCESAGTILTLITFGKYLETKSKAKTTLAIEKLINLAPKTAIVEKNGNEIEIPTEEIKKGDVVIIKPGSNIPVDGRIISGTASIDQSSITGESIPVEKVIGDDVVSGTINKNGYIKIEATKVGEETTLSQIIKLVEEASNSKAPISKVADKVSGIFVPTVILIAVIATMIWLANGQSFEFALNIGISVLVISCPCALGLATPVAIMVGTGKGASHGILIKSAEALETLHSIDTVVFDKTGTITVGKPRLLDIVLNSNNLVNTKEEFLKLLASLEKKSEHPLADAIMAKVQGVKLYDVNDFKSVSGRGVKGKINKKEYFAGNEAFMIENGINFINDEKILQLKNKYLNEGKTILYFADEKNILGFGVIADSIKESSYFAVKALKDKNIDVVMITGDNKSVANNIGSEIGIKKIIAEVLPQDKEKEVAKLQEQKRKVAFVGDGINDSPALARADVGIAIGTGTDIAIESADVVLNNDNLLTLNTAIELSRAVIRNIKINLFWAFFYNIIGIPIAAGVFYLSRGLRLCPMIGGAAMSLCSVCVVTNALTLNLFKTKKYSELSNQKQLGNESKEGDKDMYIKKISIDGMQCNHCKMTVEKVLSALEGTTKVEVNLENKVAVLESQIEMDENKIREVIEEAGFVVIEIQ